MTRVTFRRDSRQLRVYSVGLANLHTPRRDEAKGEAMTDQKGHRTRTAPAKAHQGGEKPLRETVAARRRAAGGTSAGTRRVVFVQGGGEDVHDTWDNKLVASLEQALGAGYTVRYPRMPKEADPDPRAWKKAIARELGRKPGRKLGGARDSATILVAHSVGAAILLELLAELGAGSGISGVLLGAPPFIGDGGWPSGELRPTKQAAAAIQADGMPLYLYFGANDETVPPSHARSFEEAFPRAHIRRLPGHDHQLNDDLSAVARDITQLNEACAAPGRGS